MFSMFYWIAAALRLVVTAAALALVESAFSGQVALTPSSTVVLVSSIAIFGFASDLRGITSPFWRGVRDSAASLLILSATRWVPGGAYIGFWSALVVAFLIGLATMFFPTRTAVPPASIQ